MPPGVFCIVADGVEEEEDTRSRSYFIIRGIVVQVVGRGIVVVYRGIVVVYVESRLAITLQVVPLTTASSKLLHSVPVL